MSNQQNVIHFDDSMPKACQNIVRTHTRIWFCLWQPFGIPLGFPLLVFENRPLRMAFQ